ncbi:uncharacterized protein LOC132298936 isoform X2 [Cornus florida]|uniref:uncharacterized protein LOC132298936 isoform X2 n=1 Tax=Cornus florida TaxID=4283 RepID=UPI00289BCE7E|nr:uncharacterized protein LOC132298936 isoform X2 [Cornus florida]
MGQPSQAIIPFSDSLDLDTIRSRIKELEHSHRTSSYASELLSPSDSEQLLKDFAPQLQNKISEVLSEFSEVGSLTSEDLDALKRELNSVEAEKVKISNEIEELTRAYVEDSNLLDSDLEWLNCSLELIPSLGLEKAKANRGCFAHGEDQSNLLNANGDCKFKIWELSNQIEKNKSTLKTLKDLDCIFKRFEAIEKIEDALTGLKVIEFEGNHIRLSLKTYMPNSERLLNQQKFENITEPLEQNHELLIEVVDGTMELKNVEIFPNDVYIGEIVDAAKSFRSSLEWFVRRVQDRIVLCTLRRFVVKCANKSRHSFEYLDRDEIIVAHMVGGLDAFIKVSHGWPLSNHGLKLKSLKSSSQYSKEVSLSFLCKVEDVANSLEADVRQNVSSFVDAIEEILMQHMRAELQHDKDTEK